MNDSPPRPAQLRKDVPVSIDRLVVRMLARDRDQRPASYRELVKLCNQALENPGSPARSILPIAIAAGVLVAIGAGVVLNLGTPSAQSVSAPVASAGPSGGAIQPAAGSSPAMPALPAQGPASEDAPAPSVRLDADTIAKLPWVTGKPLFDFSISQRLSGWTISDTGQWVASEERADGVTGRRGRIFQPITTWPCRITATWHFWKDDQGEPLTDVVMAGAYFADGSRIALVARNLGQGVNVTIDEFAKDSDTPINARGPLATQGADHLDISVVIGADRFLGTCADKAYFEAVRLTKPPIGLFFGLVGDGQNPTAVDLAKASISTLKP